MLKVWYSEIVTVARAAAVAQPYKDLRAACRMVLPSVHLITRTPLEVMEAEASLMSQERSGMLEFMEANKQFAQDEAAERREMLREEEYILEVV